MEKFCIASGKAKKGERKAAVMTVSEFLMKKFHVRQLCQRSLFFVGNTHANSGISSEKISAAVKLLLLFINTKGDVR